MRWPFRKTIQFLLIIGVFSCANPPAWSKARQFQFEQFPVKVYKGPIHIPKWLHKETDGEWVYETGKTASPPEVTFAGEYELDGLSCGTGCRYYELANLRTGIENPEIGMFDGGDPLPKTKDGHPYLTVLYYKSNSRLLIAEYHLDFDVPDKTETCRQRYFVFENGKIRPISKTFMFCTEEREQ
jgi:hypothetical protein